MEKEWEREALEAWNNLSIRDNFIFQRVMQNEKLCKWLLERILNVRIRDIHYPDTEKSIDLRLDSKAVRLDVYIEDDAGTVYNIEMQTTKGRDGELPRRTRYYQGMIDMDLKESITMICVRHISSLSAPLISLDGTSESIRFVIGV